MKVGASAGGLVTCATLLACGPSPAPPPAAADSPREPGDRSAIYGGKVDADPLLDPAVFEVDKPNENEARRVAEDRCGLGYALLGSREIKGTNTAKCEKGILAGALEGAQTTKAGAGAGVTCSPETSRWKKVYRFRCTKP